jgi:hypothetical protein
VVTPVLYADARGNRSSRGIERACIEDTLKRRERELHLPIDADGPRHAKVWCRLDRVLKQRGLADARLTVHDQHR